jgi:hypothetical protein
MMRLPMPPPPTDPAEFPQWVLTVVGIAMFSFVLWKALLWCNHECRGCTVPAFMMKLMLGGTGVRKGDQGYDSLPLWVPGEPRVTLRDVWDDRIGGVDSLFEVPLSICIRFAAMAAALLRVVGPPTVGWPIYGESILVGLFVVALLAPHTTYMDDPREFDKNWDVRLSLGVAAVCTIVWGSTGFGFPDWRGSLFYFGMAEVGLCLLVVALRGKTSGLVRPFAAVGWIAIMIGEVFLYQNIFDTLSGRIAVVLCVLTNFLVVGATVHRDERPAA